MLPASLKHSVYLALAVSTCFLSGCGEQTIAVSIGTPTVPVVSAGGRTGYTAFGDSITCGFVAGSATTSPPFSIGDASCHTANAYPSYIAASTGLALQNYAIPGDEACDIWPRQIGPQSVSPTIASSPLYTVLIGTNDAGTHGAGPYEADFIACNQAVLTWLAVPVESKVLVANAANSGWSLRASPVYGTVAKATSPGAALTFSFTTTGGPVYVWHVVSDGSAASASMTLDGASAGTFAAALPVPVATNNGSSDSVVAERLAAVPAGTHTLVVTVLTGPVSMIGVGTPSSLTQHPIVLAGAVPAPLQGDPRITVDAAYTADTAALVSTLRADGLDVRFAPNALYLTGAPDEMTDAVHVSPLGATHLAEAFLAVGP